MHIIRNLTTLAATLSIIFLAGYQPSLLAEEKTPERNICLNNDFEREDTKCFDLDGDKRINETEFISILKHKDTELIRALDANRDGETTNAEFAKEINNDSESAIRLNVIITNFRNAVEQEGGNTVSFEQAAELAGIQEEMQQPLADLFGFQIREEYEDIRAFESDTESQLGRLNGASFSFTSDFENDNDIFLARGAIFRPIRFLSNNPPSSSNLVLTAAAINPGISFDRVDNSSADEDDVDILEFRLGSEFEFTGGKIFNNQYLRAGLIYETDFDFDQGTFGGELQWQPSPKGIPGIGNSFKVGNLVSFRWRPILHFEGGEDYLRIGPRLSLQVWPEQEAFQRFTFSADYEFFQTLIDDSETRDLLNLGLEFRLDDTGNTSIRFGYRTGEVSLDAQDVDEFSLGFGVRF